MPELQPLVSLFLVLSDYSYLSGVLCTFGYFTITGLQSFVTLFLVLSDFLTFLRFYVHLVTSLCQSCSPLLLYFQFLVIFSLFGVSMHIWLLHYARVVALCQFISSSQSFSCLSGYLCTFGYFTMPELQPFVSLFLVLSDYSYLSVFLCTFGYFTMPELQTFVSLFLALSDFIACRGFYVHFVTSLCHYRLTSSQQYYRYIQYDNELNNI